MDRLGWRELDVLLVSGDAYLDHPSQGVALLGRWLADRGYRVGVVAQPRWDRTDDIAAMGRPRLYAGVSAGTMDSMLAHYTAFRKKRSDDAYTPGGMAGARPNRAATVYANLAKRAFPGLPVVLGGIEASLRRAVHYDFWQDKLRAPIVLDAKASAVAYGMAEAQVAEIARRLDADPDDGLKGVLGTAYAGDEGDVPEGAEVVRLPSLEEIADEPRLLLEATLTLERQVRQRDFWCVQSAGSRSVVVAPPGPGLDGKDLDRLYGLPYARRAHPSHGKPVPAMETIRFSVTSHRGCGGGCAFCSLALHQGRGVVSRSRESILAEAGSFKKIKGFTGAVSDVGGPTANMWRARCILDPESCGRASCLHPKPCPGFEADQAGYVGLLRAVRDLPGVKSVRVASGVRYDLGLRDKASLAAYVREFTGGQLKVAPEHLADHVLTLMRKPSFKVFKEFLGLFGRESGRAGKEQYVLPYLMSALPGSTDEDMRRLKAWLAERNWRPRQVQCFVPTPGTVATAMFFCGQDAKGRPVHVARTDAERLRQHAILAPAMGRPGKGGRRSRDRGGA